MAPTRTASFDCRSCSSCAAVVSLRRREDPLPQPRDPLDLDILDADRIVIEFSGEHIKALPDYLVGHVQEAITNHNAEALFRMSSEFAPFWCPTCVASYCDEHWSLLAVFDGPGWYDYSTGTCPVGHSRLSLD